MKADTHGEETKLGLTASNSRQLESKNSKIIEFDNFKLEVAHGKKYKKRHYPC